MEKKLIEKFISLYGEGGEIKSYFSPGRVNLIGEHTDYNGGHVFPCALTLGTYGVARKREDKTLRFYSINFENDGMIETSIDDMKPLKDNGWTAYPKGVIWALKKYEYKIDTGMDVLIYGTIPDGSGLSSSASLEVLTGVMLKDMFDLNITMDKIALMCQYSENNYNGCNCGIMDQFAVAMGKKDCAVFLDTSDLKYEYSEVKLDDAKIVITNSKVKHSLVDSAYNDRRNECEKALKSIQKIAKIKTLGDLSESDFETYKYIIDDEVCRRRAKHAVYENQRTIKAVETLKNNDIIEFGKLMNASHVSLRDDFEVSCDEIDILVDTAWSVPGVIGSRITGGGFGGCTVSIVKNENVDEFIEKVGKEYKEKTGITAEFYIAEIGDGARVIG
ncbi:galactokinase [Tyzzerella sp. An114]|uniref:galactokinase n=1 Tax=Tyzzerella sp. An114 TaxID=1965545 RepID=UPI000B43293A|nr:galactokinase [Tyzzerella sp. An114]OUQ56960.1 galactokinase [Tyzzerella sp. An114]